ncbi:prepilin-type N-terminal cleavage/methylation domain-containing protein [bacterium]|nr:prepilin-type N-terminal cleavage/methylation domain-containing protein [bacterium]
MKKAFTLAEVLLVLAIIGVIAALTVPNLVTSNMDKKYVALAKKAQTTLQQAIDTKMGDAAVGTNRMDGNAGILRWLATAQTDPSGVTTVPAVLRISNNAGTRYLTTDGILYHDVTNATACTNAVPCIIVVDLDGAAGITNNTVNNDLVGGDDVKSRDVVVFEIRRNFVAPADPARAAVAPFQQGATRANEYLGFLVNN